MSVISSARDGRDDVERAVVAAVRDAGDLALQLVLAAGDRDAVLVAHRLRHLGAVDRLGQLDRGDDVRVLVLGAEELEVEALDRLARRAAEQAVALEHVVEPLLLDQLERDVERHEERDGRRERAVGRILALALRRCGSSRSSSAARRRSAARASARSLGLAKPSPGGHMSAFCEPADDHVDVPLVLRQRDGAEARDRVHHDQRVVLVRDLGERLDVVDDAGRGLGEAS